MPMNLTTALRITAEVTGLKDVEKLEKALGGTENAAASAAQGFKAMGKSTAFQAAAVSAAAIGTAIAISTKAAIDFEDQMSQVLKVINDIGPGGVEALKEEVISMSKVLPIAIKDITRIYEAAGQSGIARESMRDFALTVGQVATAFDMTAEEAGQAMAKLMTALSLTVPEVRLLMDAINQLGNNTAASSRDIVSFMKRAAAQGKAAGLSAEQTAALGTAMIAAGTESRVAATSFRSMVTALTRGESMTARQVDALHRLGFAQEGATEMERRLTLEVELQSQRRIDAARNETDQIAKEITRRYRDQMTALRDNLDDQTQSILDNLQDQADAKTKALRRSMDEELRAARDKFGHDSNALDRVTDKIRDTYDDRLKIVNNNLRQQMKSQRRSDRDHLTRLTDRHNDERDLELRAVRDKFAQVKILEQQQRATGIEEAKAAAKELSKLAGRQLAQDMQQNAVGTITKIFEAIRAMPKAEQLSVITDLLGEQAARGITNLIQSFDQFSYTMGLVADQAQYAGSAQQEFERRIATVAAQIKLFQNELQALAIAFTQAALPAISAVLSVLRPVLSLIRGLVRTVPGLGAILLTLGAAFVGLTVAAPIVLAIVTTMKALGVVSLAAAVPLVVVAAKIALIGTAITLAVQLIVGFGQTVVAIFNLAKTMVHGFVVDWQMRWATAGNSINTFVSFFRNTWSSIGAWISAPFQAAIRWVNNLIAALRRVFFWQQKTRGGGSSKGSKGRKAKNAEGGFVSGAQLSWVGERGGEYIVPTGKAGAFAKNYMAGFRGSSAIPRHAEGGFVPGNANVSITTGPVTQMDGVNYITTQEMSLAVQQGVDQTLSLLRGDMEVRREMGLA